MHGYKWLIVSGIAGFLAVALGAFGAHGLKSTLLPEMLETYQTGVLYHLVHAVVMTALSLVYRREFRWALSFFVMGIVLFSFSLYAYAVTEVRFLVFVTPIGGMSFLLGWFSLVVAGIGLIREKRNNPTKS